MYSYLMYSSICSVYRKANLSLVIFLVFENIIAQIKRLRVATLYLICSWRCVCTERCFVFLINETVINIIVD